MPNKGCKSVQVEIAIWKRLREEAARRDSTMQGLVSEILCKNLLAYETEELSQKELIPRPKKQISSDW